MLLFGAMKAGARVLTAGRFNVVSDASLSFLTEDNPFTSERARRDLGWTPRVRPEDGIPEAFRWWATVRR
jgi:nucleoside-diphosphate-sugar epimerase